MAKPRQTDLLIARPFCIPSNLSYLLIDRGIYILTDIDMRNRILEAQLLYNYIVVTDSPPLSRYV